MASGTIFPANLDSFVNKINDPLEFILAQETNTQSSAIEGLEAKVGINASVVTTSHDFKLSAVVPGEKAISPSSADALTNKTGNISQWTNDSGYVTVAEATTASNVNVGGVGVFKQEAGDNLEFRGVNAASSKISVVLDAPNNEIDVDVVEANLTLDNIGGTLSTAKGGTGNITAVAAFNALSPVTTKGDLITRDVTNNVRLAVGADTFVLTADSAQATGIKWAAVSGETNTASNVNVSGVGVFKQKTALDLEFRGVNAASSKISVALDAPNNEIDLDVVEANLALANISGTLGIAKGGTGQITQTAAFDALSPLTTKGDIIVRDATNNIRVAVGTNDQVLTADSAQASGTKWATPKGEGNYVFAYDTTTQVVAVANTFQNLLFGTNAQLAGWTHTVATGIFGCTQTGLYKVNYTINLERTANPVTTAEIRALFNAVEVAGSQVGLDLPAVNESTPCTNSFILSATTGQNLTIQFTGGSVTVQASSAGANATTRPSATIVITRLT